MDVAWCLARDFNVVRIAEERKGASAGRVTREMREFDDFISNMGLNDLPLIDKKFSWHRSDGKAIGRIDRFLISNDWLDKWPDISQWGLSRTVCDHCSVLLKTVV